MTSLTLELPDAVAEEMRPLEPWLPTLLQLTLLNLQTSASGAVKEIITFLRSNPSPEEVSQFYFSQDEQDRLEYLAELNKAGKLSAAESLEVEERLQVGHIGAMMKIKAMQMIRSDQ